MPPRCSRCERNNPAGPAPNITTCVRSIETNCLFVTLPTTEGQGWGAVSPPTVVPLESTAVRHSPSTERQERDHATEQAASRRCGSCFWIFGGGWWGIGTGVN